MESLTKVVNVRVEPCDVFIGRPSKWGNPFTHYKSAARREGMTWVPTIKEAISAYKEWLEIEMWYKPELREEIKNELHGKRLGCFCKPGPCHGDVLARLADV